MSHKPEPCVYIARYEGGYYEDGYLGQRFVKIGMSKWPYLRVGELGTPEGFALYCPESSWRHPARMDLNYESLVECASKYTPLSSWDYIAVDNPRKVEREIHVALEDYRLLSTKELFLAVDEVEQGFYDIAHEEASPEWLKRHLELYAD